MTYHFSPAVAIEAETNFFPDFFEQKIQGLFGTKSVSPEKGLVCSEKPDQVS